MSVEVVDRQCTLCKERKPLTEFGSHAGREDGIQDWCRPCTNRRARELRAKETPEQREKRAERQRATYAKNRLRYLDEHRKRRYGVPLEEFLRLYEVQGRRCAICNELEGCNARTKSGQQHYLCIDHDHDNKRVRGLLCTRCNKALGGFRDDPDLLEAAADYLRQAARAEEEAT